MRALPAVALAMLVALPAGLAMAQDATVPSFSSDKRGPPKGRPAPKDGAAEPARGKGDDGDTKAKADKAGEPARKPLKSAGRRGAQPKAEVAPLASCEELRNDNGLRIIIYPPSAQSVRLALYERGGKEIDKDLLPPAKGSRLGYARVLWGTRNTPPEKLLKGAFLISTFEKGRYFEGVLMADGGDGSFLVHRMHLSKPDDDGRRWRLRLGVEQALSCRVEAAR